MELCMVSQYFDIARVTRDFLSLAGLSEPRF
jgi:hypothetical protein